MMKIQNGQMKKSVKKFKFGFEVPLIARIDVALNIDKKNGNNKLRDSMKLESDILWKCEVFEELKTTTDITKTHQFVRLLMTFDVKVNGRHKSRMCVDGSVTDDLGPEIYACVILIRAVRLLIFLAQLNDIDVCAADVSQAFLYGDCPEKVYTKAGPEFGLELNGKYLLIKKGHYDLRSSVGSYHINLSNVLYNLEFVPSHADSDLWIKDCGSHYEYIATCVDDLLIASRNPKYIILEIEKTYELKDIGIP